MSQGKCEFAPTDIQLLARPHSVEPLSCRLPPAIPPIRRPQGMYPKSTSTRMQPPSRVRKQFTEFFANGQRNSTHAIPHQYNAPPTGGELWRCSRELRQLGRCSSHPLHYCIDIACRLKIQIISRTVSESRCTSVCRASTINSLCTPPIRALETATTPSDCP